MDNEAANPTDEDGAEQRKPFVRRTYTVKETSEILGAGVNQTYEAIRRGEIPSMRLGRRFLVPAEALHRKLRGE
jgi:excisionase family DNA binding protein